VRKGFGVASCCREQVHEALAIHTAHSAALIVVGCLKIAARIGNFVATRIHQDRHERGKILVVAAWSQLKSGRWVAVAHQPAGTDQEQGQGNQTDGMRVSG
jgi:hypothetical protein